MLRIVSAMWWWSRSSDGCSLVEQSARPAWEQCVLTLTSVRECAYPAVLVKTIDTCDKLRMANSTVGRDIENGVTTQARSVEQAWHQAVLSKP